MKTIAILALVLLFAGAAFAKAEYGDIAAEFGDIEEFQDSLDIEEFQDSLDDFGEVQEDSDDEADLADETDSTDDNDPEGNVEAVGHSSRLAIYCSREIMQLYLYSQYSMRDLIFTGVVLLKLFAALDLTLKF